MILSLKRAVPLLFPFNAFFYFILRLILRQIGGFVNEESASLHFVDLPNGNAPVLQMETDEACFSFTVKTEFARKHRLRLSRQYLQIWNYPNADTLPITGRFSDLLSL